MYEAFVVRNKCTAKEREALFKYRPPNEEILGYIFKCSTCNNGIIYEHVTKEALELQISCLEELLDESKELYETHFNTNQLT